MTKKVAIFIHGWGATSNIWQRPRRNPAPLKRLFEEDYKYEVNLMDMSGKYLLPQKDFYYYARFLAKRVEEYTSITTIVPSHLTAGQPGQEKAGLSQGADEITLVCHSMGGIVARLYLKDPKIGHPEAKKKVKRVITLASPHYGTEVPIVKLANRLAPLLKDITVDAILSGVAACYRQVKLASPFMRELNTPLEGTPNIEYHCLWTRGDIVVTPIHTAILPGAKNYYIDNISVGHNNILWSVYTLRIVREILDGAPIPRGLQTYPPTDSKPGHRHLWAPSMGEKRYYLRSCRNEGCHTTAVSILPPPPSGCDIGPLDKKYRWHKWRRTGWKKFQCWKCKKIVKGKSRLKMTKCSKPGRHWWKIQSNEWVCKNKSNGKKCAKKVWSYLMPGLLGCPLGMIDNRWHFWQKREPRFQYKFVCVVCRNTVWHPD